MLGQVASTMSINMKNLDTCHNRHSFLGRSEKGYNISIKNASFGYDSNTTVVHNITMDITEGEKVAFVGPSGAGKSTIANLIARFYDPQQGKIEIGNINIKKMAYEKLMDCVAYVFQDSFTFADSILENIRMYKDEVSREEVIRVSKLAQAHRFIMELPKGYDTVLGSNGTYLSGGQKQRINIARAILKMLLLLF